MPRRTSTRRRPTTANSAEMHRRWLELVDIEGPFLAIAPLKRVWPNGMPNFRSDYRERIETLNDARRDFEAAWEKLDRKPESETAQGAFRTQRDKWVETVLRDVIGWADSLRWGPVAGVVDAQSPNRAVRISAQAALVGADGPAALVHVVDATESLRQTPRDLWAATPVDRLDHLLRKNDVDIGVVTDGRWWGLVCAGEDRMTASGVVDALTWTEEPQVRDAFFTLLGRLYLIGGDPSERLPVLFAESVAAAEEITEALGVQLRRAVELLIQSFSESAAEARRRGQPDPLPADGHEIYEAAVTVMMRTVFLLFAEERDLLPSGDLFEQGYGISGELNRLEEREQAESEQALDATSMTWHRLLATSTALFGGSTFEGLRMPAYGGSLFDPSRASFLTDVSERGALAVTVSDRVMLHILRSLQIATVKGEARRISFRDVDVEQVGYIYEGLLGYTCKRVEEPFVGLIGKEGAEPEMPLSALETLDADRDNLKQVAKAIIAWVKVNQPAAKPLTVAALAKAHGTRDLAAVSAMAQVVGDDEDLRERLRPWLGLIRNDLRDRPLIVVEGDLLVSETPSRRNAGATTPQSR